MEFKDYYSALGIERTASDDEVRKAYRKLARTYHPDVSKEPDAEKRMREINEAKDVLGDKEKRASYDALADRVARGGSPEGDFQPPPGWDSGFEFHRGPRQGPADHADFSEFFSSMFGEAERRGAAPRARTIARAAKTITRPSRSPSKTHSTAPSARSRCAHRPSTRKATRSGRTARSA